MIHELSLHVLVYENHVAIRHVKYLTYLLTFSTVHGVEVCGHSLAECVG